MDRLEELNKLIATGLKLLKINTDTNAPIEGNGVYSARAWRNADEFKYCSVGVACGDGLVVVDFDPRNYTEGTREACEDLERSLPVTWTSATPRGGKHYYFKGDTKRHKLMGAVDVQGKGSYVAAPPSVRTNLGSYVWEVAPWECEIADLPEHLIKPEITSSIKHEFDAQNEDIKTWDGSWFEVEEALSYADPNCSRKEWVEIGMALHSTGHEKAYQVFIRYSSGKMHHENRTYKNFSEKECAKVWRSFKPNSGITIATLFHHCEKYRYGHFLSQRDKDLEICDNEESFQAQIDAYTMPSYEDEGMSFGHFKFKNETKLPCLETSPLLFDIYNSVKDFVISPHDPFCYAATFAVLSSITQRGFVLDFFNGKTSTYSVILGPAGSGKDGFFNFVSGVITKIKPEIFMNEVRSSQAMKQALQDFPSRTLVVDEWPDKLIQAFKKNANQNDQEMVSLIKAVWSTKDILPGSTVKRSKENESIKNIMYPAVSIFGAGTIEKMNECVSLSEFIHGGLLSRLDLWVFEKPSIQNEKSIQISESLLGKLKRLYAEGMTKTITQDSPDASQPLSGRVLILSTEGKNTYTKFKTTCEEWSDNQRVDLKSIYDRAAEKALRYGMLHAIGRGSKLVDRVDVEFGIKIAEYLCNNYHVLINKAHSTEEHQYVQRVAKDLALFSSKTKLNSFPRRMFQIANSYFSKTLNAKQRNEVLKVLSDEYGFIEIVKGTIKILRIDRLSEISKA